MSKQVSVLYLFDIAIFGKHTMWLYSDTFSVTHIYKHKTQYETKFYQDCVDSEIRQEIDDIRMFPITLLHLKDAF